jgi:hypothetical protein
VGGDRLRLSGLLDVPRGNLEFDYNRDYDGRFEGGRTLLEDYFLRSQLRVAKTQDLFLNLRFSSGSSFGNSGSISADWRKGLPQRWHLQVERRFGFDDFTQLQAEYFIPLRVGLKVFPVGGIVTGRVYRLDNQHGVANARLAIDTRSILTDADGNYRLSGLEPGTHTLALDLGTVGAGATTQLTFPQSFELAAGETYTLDVPLSVSASISGDVTVLTVGATTAEQPAAGIIVELLDSSGTSTLRQTDALGRFNFGDAVAGTYTLRVKTAGLPEPMEAQPPQFEVTVAAGEEHSGIHFLLKTQARKIDITTGGD